MNPCQEFRLWARRAPTGERVSAGVAAVVIVALLAWLLAPGGGGSTEVATAGSGSANEGAAASDGGAAGAPGAADAAVAGAGGSTGGSAGTSGRTAGAGPSRPGAAGGAGASSAAGPGCPQPPGNVPGVSATQIKIAVTLTNVVGPAANDVFGIAQPEEQKKWYEAVLDDINKSGGVGCRKVVAQYYNTNPADQNELQQRCLQIVQSGVFAVVDNGAYAIFPQKQCYAQHKMPFFGGFALFRSEIDAFYPYLFNISELDALMKNTIFALKDRGFLSIPGKLGFTYRDCNKALVQKTMAWLQQAGVPSSNVVTYNFGCPATFASPSDLQAAILKFRQNGVTHMTAHNFIGDYANFTNIAEQQGFRPKYGLADESLIDISYGSQKPNYNNIADAIMIAAGRSGEERTPGAVPTPGTAKCNAIYQAHGLQPTYKMAPGAGYTCDALWMFQAAINNAPALHGSALAAGLQRTRSIDFSYPGGPNDFTAPRTTTGGQFWRVAQFKPACSCWQVIDPTFHPSYR